MKLYEFQGKELFKKYQISIPHSFLLKKGNINYPNNKKKFVLKGQILEGKRGKAGLIKISDKNSFQEDVNTLFNKKVDSILVEDYLPHKEEYYLSLMLDSSKKQITVIFSKNGGINIENVDKKYIHQFNINNLDKVDFETPNTQKFKELVKKIYSLMIDKDAILVEINPLIYYRKEFVALDSKVVIDDNAFFRQEFPVQGLTRREKKAFLQGMKFVEMKGDIAIIGNGAGMIMASFDLLIEHNLLPLNFLDIGAGASPDLLNKALDIVLKNQKNVKGVLINLFGGLYSCEELAKTIIDYYKKNDLKYPTVARMIGEGNKKASTFLRKEGFLISEDLSESVKKLRKKICQ